MEYKEGLLEAIKKMDDRILLVKNEIKSIGNYYDENAKQGAIMLAMQKLMAYEDSRFILLQIIERIVQAISKT